MATTSERLVAVLEVKIDKLEKDLAKATATTKASFEEIKAAGTDMETSLSGIGPKAAKGFDKVNKSMKGTAVQTSNIAAQFNDIGVQLAGGQSPFLIALQQGTQINQALGGGGLRATVAALGGAFLSLLNPLSLITIAVIALGGTAFQYFSEMFKSTKLTDEELAKQRDLMVSVAKTWGDAVPSLKAYVDQLERAKEITDLQTATQDRIATGYQSVNEVLDQFVAKYPGIVRMLEQSAEMRPDFLDALGEAWVNLRTRVEDHTATLEDYIAVEKEAAKVATSDAAPAYRELASSFTFLGGQIKATLADLLTWKTEAISAVAAVIKAVTGSWFIENGQIRKTSEFEPTTPATPTNRPLIELEGLDEPKKKKEKTDAFEAATKSIEDRTKAVEAERAAQATVNPLIDDYGFAVTKARTAQELLLAAEKEHKVVTPELKAEIESLSETYAKSTVELAKLQAQQQKTIEAVEFQKQLLSGVLSDMRSALEDGKLDWKDLGDIAGNVLNKIADKLQDMLIDQLFSAASPTGAGGVVGSILSVLGLGATAAAGGSLGGASGAAASAASVTSAAGVPAAAMGGSQKVSVESSIRVDEDGNWQARVEKISGGVAAKTGQAGLEHYRRNQMRVDVNRIAASPRVRGTI